MHFARADALKGSLKLTLGAVKPTIFFGVPRVWEKFEEAIRAIGAQSTGLKKKLSTWAKGVALRRYRALSAVSSADERSARAGAFEEALALKLLGKVHAAIGLDRAHFTFTGAAPIAPSTLGYFGSLGLTVHEVFGMSEVSGPSNVTIASCYAPGYCGPALPGVELKLERVEGRDKPGEGEVCFRGRSVMMGYLHDDEKSEQTIDAEGWLHSGDTGRLDIVRPGLAPMLKITGRIKELLITGGGENVAPVPIEDALKEALPALSCAVVIGDRLKFLSVLLTLKQRANEATGSSMTCSSARPHA